jgi:hypothetical protein
VGKASGGNIVSDADAANAAEHAAAALESAIADLAEARTHAARDLAELRAQFVAADDRAEQAEMQSRTDLDMAIEYHRECERAYDLVAMLRPAERFVHDVRQLLDIDGRGLREPAETLEAVRTLLVTCDAERESARKVAGE